MDSIERKKYTIPGACPRVWFAGTNPFVHFRKPKRTVPESRYIALLLLLRYVLYMINNVKFGQASSALGSIRLPETGA